jgi:hypothetical protein
VSTFTETVQRVIGKKEERRYTVEGDIVFEFTPAPGRELPWMQLHELRGELKLANRIHAWQDFNDYNGQEAPSFSYLSDGDYQYHNLHVPELHVWFRIVPGIDCLRRNQLHAYEQHLERVAEELSRRNLGTTSVRSVFRAGSVKKFRS